MTVPTRRLRRWVALSNDDDTLPMHLDEQGTLIHCWDTNASEQEQVIASLKRDNAKSNDMFKVRAPLALGD